MPRIQRPFWVAEQLETVVFEGVKPRVSAAIHRLVNQFRDRVARRQLADRPRKQPDNNQPSDGTSQNAHVRDGPQAVWSLLSLFFSDIC